MTTVIYLLASLLLGGLIGLGVYWPLRTTELVYRIGAGIFFGFLAMLGSAIIFLYAALEYPGVDEERFAGQNQIEVIREASLGEKEGDLKSRVSVLVAFPKNARKDYDFTVRLVASATPELGSGEYKAYLTTSKSLEVRPRYTCQGAKSEERPGVACATSQSGSELELGWDVTPSLSSEGRPDFVLSLPALWAPNASWVGHLRVGGRELIEYVNLPCARDNERRVDLGNCETRSVVLNPQRPRYSIDHNNPDLDREYEGIEVDLVANTISFPVEVTTTLGFSAATYGWLALGGTIISGMLGSGWIWKLLDAVKKRREASSSLASHT
jgi:hypothetical protein